MSYAVKILADSINVATGKRLTTMEIAFPRFILAEFNTHRMLSRSSASSRAIPVAKMLERALSNPFIPEYWGKNQKGMRAAEELQGAEREGAIALWLAARNKAVDAVRAMQELDVHKQLANRMLEPWLWHTVIVSATEWDNFFALRTHKDAQPEFRRIAVMMREMYEAHEPDFVHAGDWHLPLCEDAWDLAVDGRTPDEIARIACGRCARVSYLTHDGKRDLQADLDLADRLQRAGHMAPYEHVARAVSEDRPFGNFTGGWLQYRKTLPNEAVFISTEQQ